VILRHVSGQLFERMQALPAFTQAGRAASVRASLASAMPDRCASPASTGADEAIFMERAKSGARGGLSRYPQNARAFGVHWPMPLATMLRITEQTYLFCATSLPGPAL